MSQTVYNSILAPTMEHCVCGLVLAFLALNACPWCQCMEVARYTGYRDVRMLNGVYKTAEGFSATRCCSLCHMKEICESASFHNISRTCILSSSVGVSVNIPSYVEAAVGWKVYGKDWSLVFRGITGVSVDVYDSWVNGNLVTNDVTCRGLVTSCPSHYRDSIVDSWASLGVTKVKFALYEGGAEVAFVVFDGTGSTSTDWFAAGRILESSWDITRTQTYNYFSASGHGPTRRFFINSLYDGCPADTGYTLALIQKHFQCNFDIQTAYPQFLYSKTSSFVYWESGIDVGYADSMVIYLSTM